MKSLVRCPGPGCGKQFEIDVPSTEFDALKERGIVGISTTLGCGHTCLLYFDTKCKYRSGQAADIVLDNSHSVDVNIDDETLDNDVDKDMLHKLTSEIIMLDAKEYAGIRAINAEENVDIAELALLSGDVDAARIIFTDLAEFCEGLDDDDLAASLKGRVKRINLLRSSDTDLDSMLEDLSHEITESERKKERDERLLQMDEIITDLKFYNLKGDISNSEYEYKRSRLLDLKQKL